MDTRNEAPEEKSAAKPASAVKTVQWLATRGDSVVKDKDGNVLTINGKQVSAPTTGGKKDA